MYIIIIDIIYVYIGQENSHKILAEMVYSDL